MVKKVLPIIMLAVLTGCSGGLSKASDEEQKEYILTQLNDYQGLIEIYRKKLSAKDNADDRYHLSQLYNKIGDYSSSNIYLAPLAEKSSDKKYLLLKANNLIELGQEEQSEVILNELIAKDSSNGELWNLRGILLAQQGKYSDAMASFERARGLFYNEEIVINNIAMMEILQQKYIKARDHLLSLYSRKKYRPQTVYNLVYSLVKLKDYDSARKIIIDEKLSASEPEQLINSLANLSPREQFQLSPKQVPPENKDIIKIKDTAKKEASQGSVLEASSLSQSKKNSAHNSPVNKKDSQTCQIGDNISGSILPFTGKIENAKYIAKLTAAGNGKGNRLALYSSYPLNFMLLPKIFDNQIEIELFGTQPLKSIYTSQLAIMKSHPGIKKIEFINKGDGDAILRIVTAYCLASKTIERASVKGKFKEKLIIDFTYK